MATKVTKPPVSEMDLMRFSPSFEMLAGLIGEEKALKALRVEREYVREHPDTPVGSDFARRVRQWLVTQELEWTKENLTKAIAAVQSEAGS